MSLGYAKDILQKPLNIQKSILDNMVEFNTAYYSPMDRKYHESVEMEPTAKAGIEEPIIPMIELGTTVPETDPTGRFKNMIQNVQANIRRGAGRIQLVLSTAANSPMGGRPKAYGPEVREQMREVFKANEAILTGVEMPTNSINNLSGFDGKTLSEEMRRNNLDEIRDAIKFTADVAQGGGVDLVSFEFPRAIFDASWNKDPKTGKPIFEDTKEKSVFIVDDRTGAIDQWRIDMLEKIPINIDKETGERFEYDLEKRKFILEKDGRIIKEIDKLPTWKWQDFVEHAEKKKINPVQFVMTEVNEGKKRELEASATYHENTARNYREKAKNFQEMLDKGVFLDEEGKVMTDRQGNERKLDDRGKEFVTRNRDHFKKLYREELGGVESVRNRVAQMDEDIQHMASLNEFGKDMSVKGYAEAGAMAMLETHNNKFAERPVHVGPEIGWPDYFGGHPAEFTEIIKKAREKMAEMLTSKTVDGEPNVYFQPGMSEKEAEQEAKMHIKGCFDTSHMGMWLKHFKPELPWDQRVKEFNAWYMEEIKKLAKSDMIGTIQVVNSMSAAHGHNPPGQGIFPVVEATREFKRQGFKGYIVSEGHDEEKFDEGRILVETWRAFNAPFESKYGPGMRPQGFNDMQSGYAGRQYSPRQMFGSYTPPFGEYKPWSEIPFE